MNELVGEIILIICIVDDHARVVRVCGRFKLVVVERDVRRIVHGWKVGKRERVVVVEVLLMRGWILLHLLIVKVLMLLLVRARA